MMPSSSVHSSKRTNIPGDKKISASDEDDKKLLDLVDTILVSERNRKEAASSPIAAMRDRSSQSLSREAATGPLTPRELSTLSMFCTRLSEKKKRRTEMQSGGFGSLEGSALESLAELLEKQVNLAVGIDLIQESVSVLQDQEENLDDWLSNGRGFQRTTALRLGLEAASILLFIMTSPDVEGHVVTEDAVQSSIMLLRLNLTKNIIPSLNNTGHLIATSADSQNIQEDTFSPRKRRRRSSGGKSTMAKDLKKAYKQIASTIGLQLNLMERLEVLIQSVSLEEQHIFTITSGVLAALEIDSASSQDKNAPPASLLQAATINLVTAVFRKYLTHRDMILLDLFPLMLKLPTSRKGLRSFPIRYNSFSSPKGLHTLITSIFPSTCIAADHCDQFIQTITALILSLVQACVVRPTYSETEAVEKTYDDSRPRDESKFVSGLRDCKAICYSFATQLAQRCSRKGEDGGASEFRPVLTNLVDDLLRVSLVPEYPGAELLLLAISSVLCNDIAQSSSSFKKTSTSTLETTYLNTAFDSVGKICAAQAQVMAVQRAKPLKSIADPGALDRRRVDCYCARAEWTDKLMLDCDECHTWYHAKCIGLNRESLPTEWLCDPCQVKRVLAMERAQFDFLASDESPSFPTSTFAIHRIFHSHLRNGFTAASQLHLAKWVEELNRGKRSPSSETSATSKGLHIASAKLLESWEGVDIANHRGEAPHQSSLKALTEEGGIRALLILAATSETFVASFRNQMGLLIRVMSDKTTASLRKLAVKAIEKVVDADPKLMLSPMVMKAVSQRFSDDSISVREAVVSLVGSYVVQTPALANAFHSSLLPRLTDPGVSVRKRTVKILQDILCSNTGYKGRYIACDQLLQRAVDRKEDEGVQEAIHSLFMTIWLENGTEAMSSYHGISAQTGHIVSSPSKPAVQKDGTGLVTPTPPDTPRRDCGYKTGKLRIENAAEQMVGVTRAAGNSENLTNFMRELLLTSTDSDSTRKSFERHKRQKNAQLKCIQLVEVLFELLLHAEENRAHFGRNFGQEVIAISRTIYVFAEVAPSCVVKHLDTILPYLKADNGLEPNEESVVTSVMSDVLHRLVSVLDRGDIERMGAGSIGQDLVKISYGFGSTSLNSAVRALSALAHHRGAGEKSSLGKRLMGLAKTFYTYLCNHQASEDFSSINNNIQRSLSALGSLCRHHILTIDSTTWEGEIQNEENEVIPSHTLTWSNIPTACFRLFLKYLKKGDLSIKCTSLQALGGLFIAHPRLLFAMEQTGLIEEVMAPDSHMDLQLEALRCWREILLFEEKRIESGDAKAKMDDNKDMTTSKKIAGDQDGDSTLFGGVLTKHAPRLFAMTQAKESILRYNSLDLIGHLLRQGLVNPNEAVPYLFALQGDVDDLTVRSLALQLLSIEGERRPDMFRQRFSEGVKEAYRFQDKVSLGNSGVSALVQKKKGDQVLIECVFDGVFKECIRKSRTLREAFFKNLIVLFEFSAVEEESKKARRKSATKRKGEHKLSLEPAVVPLDLPLLSFCSQILAHLPYSSPGDPLYIIYQSSTILSLQGPQLLDRFAAFLRQYELASADEYDDVIAEEDLLEKAAKSKSPLQSDHVSPFPSGFDWNGFLVMCRQASAMTLLLRLNIFLRKAYNLSEARCLEYNPDLKERNLGKSVSKSDTSGKFKASIISSLEHQKLSRKEKEKLIRQYAEFRRLMRQETCSESEAADDEDTSSKKRKSTTDEHIE